MPGSTVTLPAVWSLANAAAWADQARRGSSPKGMAVDGSMASVGRSLRYDASATGASTDSASIPPARKIDTRIGLVGRWRSAASAMPSDSARPPKPSRPAPYTETRPPAALSSSRRRSMPDPAGAGIRGSDSRGLAAARVAWAGDRPSQHVGTRESISTSASRASSG